jgi:hypothetical protein
MVSHVTDGDDETCGAENKSEVSVKGNTGAPRSLHTVMTTEPTDFFEEHWQTQE